MASLWYALHEGAAEVGSGYPVTGGAIATLSASNQQTAALGSAGKQYRVRLFADGSAFIAVGSNPDATTATERHAMASETPEWFWIEGGDKVAAITR